MKQIHWDDLRKLRNLFLAWLIIISSVSLIVYSIGCASSGVWRADPPERPTYVIHKWTSDELFGLLRVFQSMIGENLSKEWRIGLYKEWIQAKSTEEETRPDEAALASGITLPDKKIIYLFAWQKCLAASALAHELMHALGYDVHSPRVKSYIIYMENIVIKRTCPGYKREPMPPPNAIFVFKEDLRKEI